MTNLYDVAKRLSELLVERGVYDKVLIESSSGECILLAAKRGEEIHIIALSSYEDWVYAKIAHSDAIPSTSWTCNNVYYTPYGLYAFARSVDELAEKIASKQQRLAAQKKLLEAALEAGALG